MALWMAAMGQAGAQDTFCNPLNLEYRFNLETGTYREAADPMVVLYQGDYYLFASKSGGYWWSEDFADWHFVAPDKPLDIEKSCPGSLADRGMGVLHLFGERCHLPEQEPQERTVV